ncbi:MAG: phosphatase PAP2 family protein [Bacteroidota bacterium]
MIETLVHIDTLLFQWLNGLHAAWLDPVMVFLSHKLSWIPAYLLLFILLIQREHWKRVLLFLLCVGLLIGLTDQTTSSFLKPSVKRYRPCHLAADLDFDVHTVNNKCGGKYGFASSHAANFFGLATFLAMYFRRRKLSALFFSLAALVAYTRIYLGVHFPGDILAGAAIGCVFGILLSRLYAILAPFPIFSPPITE